MAVAHLSAAIQPKKPLPLQDLARVSGRHAKIAASRRRTVARDAGRRVVTRVATSDALLRHEFPRSPQVLPEATSEQIAAFFEDLPGETIWRSAIGLASNSLRCWHARFAWEVWMPDGGTQGGVTVRSDGQYVSLSCFCHNRDDFDHGHGQSGSASSRAGLRELLDDALHLAIAGNRRYRLRFTRWGKSDDRSWKTAGPCQPKTGILLPGYGEMTAWKKSKKSPHDTN